MKRRKGQREVGGEKRGYQTLIRTERSFGAIEAGQGGGEELNGKRVTKKRGRKNGGKAKPVEGLKNHAA